MATRRKYVFNPTTFMYEIHEEPKSHRIIRTVVFVVVGVGLAWFYFWLYTSVLGLELPKTVRLKKIHARWESKMDVLNRRIDVYDITLKGIEDRDDDVYRSIYGLDPIPDEIKMAGYGGVNRYGYLDDFGASPYLKSTLKRLDVMTKRSYLQSRSLDEIKEIAVQAGDMISCIPAVPPFNPAPGSYHLSSPFGYRSDPMSGSHKVHEGQDFAAQKGKEVYATGDGVVEYVKFQFTGYGNEILINHGFGYQTRYAHLNSVTVGAGMKVRRGQLIGTIGSSGKSTGPHLHYEVILRGNRVNPRNYMDLDMSVEEYQAMVDKREEENQPSRPTSTGEILRRRRAVE